MFIKSPKCLNSWISANFRKQATYAVVFSLSGGLLLAPAQLSAMPFIFGSGGQIQSRSQDAMRDELLLVHCCHNHPYQPYDNYCCHEPNYYYNPGAAVAGAVVGGAIAYGTYRGVKHHAKHHKKNHKNKPKPRRQPRGR